MTRGTLTEILTTLMDRPWFNRAHISQQVRRLRGLSAQGHGDEDSLMSSAICDVLSQMEDYCVSVDEEIGKGFGQVFAEAEMHRLYMHMHTGFSVVVAALNSGDVKALSAAHIQFVRLWRTFEREDIDRVVREGLQD